MTQSSPTYVPHPLIILALAFMVGIVGVQKSSLPTAPSILVTAAFSLLAVLCLSWRRFLAAGVFLCLAFSFAGATLTVVDRHKHANDLGVLLDQGAVLAGEPLELTGVLEQQPEAASGSFYLILRVEDLKANGNSRPVVGMVSLFLPLSDELAVAAFNRLELRYGTRIRALATLRREDTFRNPGGSSFKESLERKGLAASGLIKSPFLIQRLNHQNVALPLAWLYNWRQRLLHEFNTHFAPETAGVLNASVLGNRYFLSHAASERLREGGTFHVLVISGLHISFIGGLVLLLARKVFARRLTQFVLSAVVLWSYSLAVGAEASVVRAALMFTLVAFAPVVARRAASLNALGAAALVLLALRPGDLFDPSFQLTFLSVAAIVVFAWPLLRRMSEIGSWRPTRASPYPPSCPRWLRVLSEALFWEEKKWLRELPTLNYRYRLFKTPWARRLERFHLQTFLRYGFAVVLVSVCVQITMLPLLVLYFHRLSISGLVLNIGVSVLMALMIFTGLTVVLIAQISLSAIAPLVSLANGLQWLMVHGVDPFTHIGIASLRLPEYTGYAAAVYGGFFLPLVSLAFGVARWKPLCAPGSGALDMRFRRLMSLAALAQAALVAVIVFHPFSASGSAGLLHVDFLDVGQGDAALITMPDGSTLLVDGGGRPEFKRTTDSDSAPSFVRDTRSIGDAVVSEYLWWRGLDHVDYLLATHADADHIDGLNDIARNFRVRAALLARTPANDPEFTKLAETLRQESIPLQLIGAGDTLAFGPVQTRVLWPLADDNVQSRSGNNDSVVLQMEFGDRKLLLLADIESKAELALLSGETRTALRADVVKVAHHGSRTSSSEGFVKAVSPKIAIISVGRRSMFGHPHAEVVQRWNAVGAETLTTGEKGTITITTDGRELKVTRFVQ
jgi:competence protein ComEC